MVTARRARLQVVPLEDRTVPTVITDFNGAGALTAIHEDADGQSGAVTLTMSPGNFMNVREGAENRGTFLVAEQLHIDLGTHVSGLVNRLMLNDNTLQTDLDVDLSGQATQFRVVGGTSGQATIDGNVEVRGGEASQFFLFGELGSPTRHVTNITGSLTVDMGEGGGGKGPPEAVGTVGVPPDPSLANVDGNVTVRNSTIFVWAGRIGGNLTVDSPKPFDQQVFLGNFNREMSIGGNVSIRTGDGADHVAIQSTLVEHDTEVDTGGGDDLLQFGIGENDPKNAGFNDATATISGNLAIRLGDGDDKAFFGAKSKTNPGQTNPLTVGGNLSVDAGAGNDVLVFPDATVQGSSISIDTGDGNDRVRVARLIAPQADLSVDLGAGHDVFRFQNHAAVSLKHATIDGGAGDDVFGPGAGNNFDFSIDRISI